MRPAADNTTAAMRRSLSLLERVDYRLTQTAAEKEEIYNLRYRAYLREGMVKESAERRIAWDATDKGEFKLVHSLEQAKQAIRDVSERETYLDVHEWCFTPTSFRLMMRDLFELGFIQLKELAFYPTTGSEFYVALSRSGELPAGTRLELLQQVDREQSHS